MWVIVDQLTKSAHFLAVHMTFTLEEFYQLYIREIVRLHECQSLLYRTRIPGLRHTFGHEDTVDDEHRFSSTDIWLI